MTAAFTLAQYRVHQKAEFLRDYLPESQAAAKLLGDRLKDLRFDFATASQHGDRSRSVRIEFRGNDQTVWVDAKGNEAEIVLIKSPTEFFSTGMPR